MSTTEADRRAVVQAFCDECVWVYCIRKHFGDLFEGSECRLQLLSEVAITFFHDLNLVLIDYLLLQLCKLTDPASDGKDRVNLTTNFIAGLDWTDSTACRLHAANEKLLGFRSLIINARRKLIAHLDLKARLSPMDMGVFTPDDEQSFWVALQEFVATAHEEAVGQPFDLKVAMPVGDVSSLIHCLIDAVDYADIAKEESGFLLSRARERRFDNA